MNEYDSARIGDVLATQCGMRETDSPDGADVLLLNTCSVREKPQEKLFHQLGRWKQFKHRNPDTLIAVGGCVASQEGARLGERAPFVDVVFGPQTLHRLPQLLARAEKRTQSIPVVDISFPEIEKFDCLPPPRTTGSRAFVSIMEGCSRYCSFCVVPYTRGEEFSRPFEKVLDEIRILSEQGVCEVTLLGQNVNAYRGENAHGTLCDLPDLIYAIAEMPAIERIRFTTSHPIMFDQGLVDAYADIPKLAGHLHLPVQSGSDRVLAAMKRGYTAQEYKYKIRTLRAVRPDISISSDFIVGFPGERDEDFEATMDMVEAIGFDHSYSFIYSRRPGTPAASLTDNVPMAEKKKRLYRLQTELTEQAGRIAEGMVGTTQRVLTEGVSAKNTNELQGRCENNHMVVFEHPTPQEALDNFVSIRIDSALAHCLRGRIVDNSAMIGTQLKASC